MPDPKTVNEYNTGWHINKTRRLDGSVVSVCVKTTSSTKFREVQTRSSRSFPIIAADVAYPWLNDWTRLQWTLRS